MDRCGKAWKGVGKCVWGLRRGGGMWGEVYCTQCEKVWGEVMRSGGVGEEVRVYHTFPNPTPLPTS